MLSSVSCIFYFLKKIKIKEIHDQIKLFSADKCKNFL